MPNIQICGFSAQKSQRLRTIVDEVVQELGLGADAVTSIVNCDVRHCDGLKVSAPYLRICSTSAKEIRTIIKALKAKKAWVDVEWLVLDGFIPDHEMCS